MVTAQGMDLLISDVGGLLLSISLAEKLKIPLIQAYIFPFTPTKAFPAVVFPQSMTRPILVPTYFVSASLGKGLLPFNDEAISRLRTQLS